jgi:hypothetical protein
LLLLAVLIPVPVRAAPSNTDAWLDARAAQQTHAAAIASAARALADGGDEDELRELRRRVVAAVRAMDDLDVRACFRVWWSYVRTSFVLYDQALIGLEASDLARVQTATAASTFLNAMAATTTVDCTRSDISTRSAATPGPRGGGRALATAASVGGSSS